MISEVRRMKKKDVINLIRCYAEKNDEGFRNQGYKIAEDFDAIGNHQLAEYVMSLLSSANTFVPQEDTLVNSFIEKVDLKADSLFLPDMIVKDLIGIGQAVRRNIGIHKFLFYGSPGTGKTEAVKQLGKLMNREVYSVNLSSLIDSRLGQTSKNLQTLLREINSFYRPENILLLLDELDTIALDRTNPHDVREMGRVTSEFLKLLDQIKPNIPLVATTNLYESFDKAVLRRFDAQIDFNRYSRDDLITVAENLLNQYLVQFKFAKKNIRLFRKILFITPVIPMPGDLKNIIKKSLAFSDEKDGNDYFRLIYRDLLNEQPSDIQRLKQQGFTLREIEILSQIPRSSVDRKLKDKESTDA